MIARIGQLVYAIRVFVCLLPRRWDWCDFEERWVRRSPRRCWSVAWHIARPPECGGLTGKIKEANDD